MSQLSPKKREPMYYDEEEDVKDVPVYHKPDQKPRFGRVGQYKGRVGISELAQIVGSKMNRNIKRSSNFMPGQFDIWNDKPTGGNNKYWGDYQDVDGDGLAHEFVVRRGGEDGPMVAVNGYTTGQSDWIARRAFYEHYPTRAERKGKSAKSYMRDEYYVPTYNEYGEITDWGIEPGSDKDSWREYTQYNRYIPKKLSAYQAFQKAIAKPAFDAYLKKNNLTKQQYMQDYGGVKAISIVMSNLYGELVKRPIIKSLTDNGAKAEIEEMLLTNKPALKALRSSSSIEDKLAYNAELEKYIFSKKAVKDVVNKYTRELITKRADILKEAAEEIESMHEE